MYGNMSRVECLGILLLLVGHMMTSSVCQKTVVCYLAAVAANRPGQGKFTVGHADTEHCTHVIYAFVGIDPETYGLKSIDPYVDLPQNGRGMNQFAKLKELKATKPNLKVLISVGGNLEKGKKFSDIAKDPQLRRTFIDSALNFLKEYQLDGIDICWQFPGERGGIRNDSKNSVTLFQELKDALQPYGYLLTVHILGKKYVIDKYDMKFLSETVDFINLMAMEYTRPWLKTTGIMAPLKSKDHNNVIFAVDYTLHKVSNPQKVLLGLPLYGFAYILEEKPSKDHLIGLYSFETFREPWTNDRGIIGFHESCYNLRYTSQGWVKVWHEESQTPLAFKDKYFVSYDDEKSLLLKADLVNKKNLGGVAFWSMDTDDFHGLCFNKKFPMISAVTDYINKNNGTTSTEAQVNPSDGCCEEPDDLGPPDQ